MKELLKEPTKSGGTATNCDIPRMNTAAKTGTTNSKKDKWLCGFTPYYTAATWYGYDQPERVYNDTYASVIWANVMKEIHKDLDEKSFDKPGGIVKATVCKDSGMLASDSCKNDPRGSRVYTEYFVKGTEPKKTCTTHVTAEICEKSGNRATDKCEHKKTGVFITRDSDSKKWSSAADAKYMLTNKECTECSGKEDKEAPKISLNGSSTINLKVNEKYNEQGAKATDNTDGDLTEKIETKGSVDVDTSKAGTYTITYSVKDSNGNTASTKRTVIVSSEKADKDNNKEKDNKDTKEDEKKTENKAEPKNNEVSENG